MPTFQRMFEVIRHQLSRTVPFTKLLAITVDSLVAGAAATTLPPVPHHNNQGGSVHAGALFTLCEAASGAALAGVLLPVIMETRFVLRDARICYLRPARGSLRARAVLVEDTGAVLDELRSSRRADVSVDVTAHAVDGSLVAKASFDWTLALHTE